jgi:hypothetical protein
MDKEEKGIFITFESREQAEQYLNEQLDVISEPSVRCGMHIVEKERLTTSERNKKAFAIANNAIYFNDNSDYLSALYQVCKMLNPQDEENLIGKKYIEE